MLTNTYFILLLLATYVATNPEIVRYDNYQVYRITPTNKEALKILHELQHNVTFEFWTEVTAVGVSVDIMVAPKHKEVLSKIAQNRGFQSNILIENVQTLIEQENPVTKAGDDFGWTAYYSLNQINAWLESLVEKYPKQVSLETGGQTYEGRDIRGVRVSFSPDNENRSVVIEANIHACEWIGSSVATYILNEILTNSDPQVRAIAESHDWYVFPVLNVDGFQYTQTTDRLWRKTRSVQTATCVGVDPNRNWGYHFNEGGYSTDPCNMMYSGPGPFSEIETKTLSEYLLGLQGKLVGYISYHSYAQKVLLPYGYTDEHLDNYDELYSVGKKAIQRLQSHYGTEYDIGNVAEVLYVASGGSPDWVKGILKPRISYTFELRDTGEFGFLLPARLILPTAVETFDAFLGIFQEFAKLDDQK